MNCTALPRPWQRARRAQPCPIEPLSHAVLDVVRRFDCVTCAICGDECIHVESVRSRPDDSGIEVELKFFGECGHRFALRLDSRKGATLTTWQRLLPDCEGYNV